MCTPDAYSAARSVGKQREDLSKVPGVNLDTLKDTARQMQLKSTMTFTPLKGIALNPTADITRQQNPVRY